MDPEDEDVIIIKPKKNFCGIRNIKALFGSIQEDEDKREEALKVEEEELGFIPDKDEEHAENLEKNSQESDPDSGSDGELGALSDIM